MTTERFVLLLKTGRIGLTILTSCSEEYAHVAEQSDASETIAPGDDADVATGTLSLQLENGAEKRG